MLFCYT